MSDEVVGDEVFVQVPLRDLYDALVEGRFTAKRRLKTLAIIKHDQYLKKTP